MSLFLPDAFSNLPDFTAQQQCQAGGKHPHYPRLLMKWAGNVLWCCPQVDLRDLESTQCAGRRFSCNLILKGAKTRRETITIAWQEGGGGDAAFPGPGMTLQCVENYQSRCQSGFKSPNILVLRPSPNTC